jgi:hypothetical protein
MRNIGLFVLLFFIGTITTQAQPSLQAKLFYYQPKGVGFVPILSKPSLMYNGQLYIGRKQLDVLFKQLNDPSLDSRYKRYKSQTTLGTVLKTAGSLTSVVGNIILLSNGDGFNWVLFGGGLLLSGTGSFFTNNAQKHLLYAAIQYNQNKGLSYKLHPRQSQIGIAVPLHFFSK